MSCFITLVFCSNKRRFYFDNTDAPLTRSPLPLCGYLLAFRLKYSWKSPYIELNQEKNNKPNKRIE